ncbi:MAG: AMP-binding protein [Opitutales bacterium]|nr:AMP-binding protein [Opitutales bacterium]
MNDWSSALVDLAMASLSEAECAGAASWAQRLKVPPQAENLPVVLTVSNLPRFWAGLRWCWENGYFPLLANPSWGESERQALARTFPGYLRLSDQSLIHESGRAGEGFVVPSDLLLGIATGGSGGSVRFALHGEKNLRVAAKGYLEWLGTTKANALAALPPWHVSGFMPVVRALEGGGRVAWADPGSPGKAICRIAAQPDFGGVLSLVPTQLARLLTDSEVCGALACFDGVLVGGASVPKEFAGRCVEEGIPLRVSYGATETAAMVAAAEGLNEEGEWAFAPLPHATISVREGEVTVASEALACGYWGETFGFHGIWRSGDRGVLTGEGRFQVLGRKRRTLNTGGEKVDPAEVEEVLRQFEQVQECWVEAFPDPEWGEVVFAVWTGNAGQTPDWPKALASRMAKHKIPRVFLHTPSSPLDPRGKFPVSHWRQMARQQWHGGGPQL